MAARHALARKNRQQFVLRKVLSHVSPARLVSDCCCSEKGVSLYRISHKQSTLEVALKNAKLFASEACALKTQNEQD